MFPTGSPCDERNHLTTGILENMSFTLATSDSTNGAFYENAVILLFTIDLNI
jgi:hypothetical protein